MDSREYQDALREFRRIEREIEAYDQIRYLTGYVLKTFSDADMVPVHLPEILETLIASEKDLMERKFVLEHRMMVEELKMAVERSKGKCQS